MSQTISEIHEKLLPLLGKEYTLPITTNKGLPGQFLETLLDIPHTSRCLDCSDGELKLFPLKQLKNGLLVPKETVAVTMLSPEELRTTAFEGSRCCTKLSNLLMVAYYRTGDTIRFVAAQRICKDSPEYVALYATLAADYAEIRRLYLETETLTSLTGTLLQNRTKGAGHGSTSRAFYLRPEFMKQYVPVPPF